MTRNNMFKLFSNMVLGSGNSYPNNEFDIILNVIFMVEALTSRQLRSYSFLLAQQKKNQIKKKMTFITVIYLQFHFISLSKS